MRYWSCSLRKSCLPKRKKTINEKERKMYFIKEKRKVKLITRAFFKTTTYLIVKIK